MAVNLTPQYHEAEAEYRKAQSAEDKLTALKKMWVELPKHKASEKVQAELKRKMSDLREEIETDKKSPKKGVSYKIPRQGAGQVIIIGGANAGKSCLLSKLTRATPAVAPYPFTTHEPMPGMMDWEDAKVQLIDTPPITADYLEPYLSSMVRNADVALLMVDIGDDDGAFAAEPVIEKLAERKTVLVGQIPENDEDPTIVHLRTLLVANKCDLPGAVDRLEIVKEMFGSRFPLHIIAAEAGTGLPELRHEIFKALEVIRVYTKKPGKPADKTSPYTLPIGSTVVDLATQVHRELGETLKTAKVWGTGVFDGQAVPRDHVLHDQDVVELHA